MEFSDAPATDEESEEGSQCSEGGRRELNDGEDKESREHEGKQHEAGSFESIFGNHNRHNQYHENLGSKNRQSSIDTVREI